jgi:hypothetical protein
MHPGDIFPTVAHFHLQCLDIFTQTQLHKLVLDLDTTKKVVVIFTLIEAETASTEVKTLVHQEVT